MHHQTLAVAGSFRVLVRHRRIVVRQVFVQNDGGKTNISSLKTILNVPRLRRGGVTAVQ